MIVKREKALISACLMGVECRYDGGHKYTSAVRALSETWNLVPCCPEELGGLPTPRPPASVVGGSGGDVLDGRARVLRNEGGADVTAEFLRGAHAALEIAREGGIRRAFLKSRSPSCGAGSMPVDSGGAGDGVTAALLRREGIDVEDVDE